MRSIRIHIFSLFNSLCKQLKYKRRVYKMLHLDEKQLRSLHTRVNLRRFFDYVTSGQTEKITKMCAKGLDPNIHCQETGGKSRYLQYPHLYTLFSSSVETTNVVNAYFLFYFIFFFFTVNITHVICRESLVTLGGWCLSFFFLSPPPRDPITNCVQKNARLTFVD